ncbi:Alpha/Beta hydrolase protein [Melanogaster broomeanus]|nr:Alpha/Beta hydrolase protein [Melanogaster broomeanus]
MTEAPFSISVSAQQLETLQEKLQLANFPDELDDAGWTYGVPLADIKRLVQRWKDGYDWRKYEAELNDELPMFTRDIEVDGFGTLNIHYVHKKSEVVDAIPLLFCHGWPGSFCEVRKLLPLLTATSPKNPSFHVVSLSLPGYGFSEAPRKQGFKGAQYAEVAHKLMLALGYNEYVTQSGDSGSMIARKMGILYGGKHHMAWHTNFPRAVPPSLTKNPLSFFIYLVTPFSAAEKAGFAHTDWFRTWGMGYSAEQSTQPQTLGYSLADSPVGLLAWIYEKLHNWTDNYPWEDDEGDGDLLTSTTSGAVVLMLLFAVLTWVSIYWFSRAGPAASLRIYFEYTNDKEQSESLFLKIPMGASFFPKELCIVPSAWVRRDNHLVSEFNHESGGHFAAHEKPEELVGDLHKMFGKGGGAYGVVPGKTGYQ